MPITNALVAGAKVHGICRDQGTFMTLMGEEYSNMCLIKSLAAGIRNAVGEGYARDRDLMELVQELRPVNDDNLPSTSPDNFELMDVFYSDQELRSIPQSDSVVCPYYLQSGVILFLLARNCTLNVFVQDETDHQRPPADGCCYTRLYYCGREQDPELFAEAEHEVNIYFHGLHYQLFELRPEPTYQQPRQPAEIDHESFALAMRLLLEDSKPKQPCRAAEIDRESHALAMRLLIEDIQVALCM